MKSSKRDDRFQKGMRGSKGVKMSQKGMRVSKRDERFQQEGEEDGGTGCEADLLNGHISISCLTIF